MFEPVRDTPKWVREIDSISVVLPEPPLVQKYGGGQRVDLDEQYEYCLSDASLSNLVRAGTTLIWLPYFSGFGLEFEKTEMERIRDFSQRARAKGLKTAFCISLGSLTPETLLIEEPDAHNWLQVNHDGQLCGSGGGSAGARTFRARPCVNSEGFMRYIERVCNSAVDCGADLVHFTGTGYNPEPDTCHCPLCVTAFREFLRRQYGTQTEQTRQAGQERFGHHTFIHARPPIAGRGHASSDPIVSPHQQEWIRFKVHSVTHALARLSQAIAKRNPECAVGADLLQDGKANSDASFAINYSEQLPLIQSALRLPASSKKMEINNLRTLYKVARAFNIVFSIRPFGMPADLRITANLAFSQNGPGVLGEPTDPQFKNEAASASVQFYNRNRELFRNSTSAATVAVFRDTPSLAFDGASCLNEVESALLDNHIPFDLIFSWDAKALGAYRCILLANPKCLSDEIIKSLEAYVHSGGGLVIVDDAGSRDVWYRKRMKPSLQALIGSPEGAQSDYIRNQSGQGRVAYLQRGLATGARYAEAIAFASGIENPCTVSVESGEVVSECRRIDSSTLIHILNPGADPARGLRVSLACQASPQKVVPLSPTHPHEPIPFTCDNGRLHFYFDEVERYVLFRVDY